MNPQSSSNALASKVPLQLSLITQRPGYFVAGAGAPVVMLHSSLSSKSQWTTLAELLAPRFRVIAIDLCGYGDNAMNGVAQAPFTLDEEVRLFTALLDRLVASHVRVHVVGHSYGGLVALRFAQLNPDRVASLSLYEPVVFRILNDADAALADARQLAQRITSLIATGHRHEATQGFVDFWSGEGSYAALPLATRVSIARRIDKVPLDFQAALSWPLRRTDIRAIVAPTLLLVGDRSPAVVQRIATLMTETLPDRRVRRFDFGHMGPITDANRVNPWIEAFVDVCSGRVTALPPRLIASPESSGSQ